MSVVLALFSVMGISSAQESGRSLVFLGSTGSANDYVIDNENVLQVDVYYGKGEKISHKVRVSSAGSINFPLIGEVQVGGLTILQFQEKLRRNLAEDFLVNPQVTVFIEEYSNVSIMGEVKKPGAYPIKGALTVVGIISLAEGFGEVASPNEVKVIRTKPDGTKEETTVHVMDIMNKVAADSEDLVLRSGDLVIVPKSTVTVMGAVKKPGVYPTKGRLSVVDLIALAEGFSDLASPNEVKVIHHNADGTKTEAEVRARDIMNKVSTESEGFMLRSGDVVVVPEGKVSIMGEVKRPGVYPTQGRLTVVDLIALAGGFSELASPNDVRVIHTEADGAKTEVVLRVNAGRNSGADDNKDLLLRSGDVVVVPEGKVSIMGEVKRPGVYPTQSRLTVVDLIALAGGFSELASPNDVRVIHANADGIKTEVVVRVNAGMNSKSDENKDSLLRSGDVVVVPEGKVSIMGEVKKPGAYPVKGSLSILQLIALSEGFTKIAATNKVKIIHTNPDGSKSESVLRVYDLINKDSANNENVLLQSGDVVIVPESLF